MPTSKASLNFKREQRAVFVLTDGYLDEQKRNQLYNLIPADSPSETMHHIEAGVESGKFKIKHVYQAGEIVGWTVYIIEENEAGKEFISIASHGVGKHGADLTRKIIPILEHIARQEGCKTIRLHTMRTGLVKKLNALDWFVSEIVCRKEL